MNAGEVETEALATHACDAANSKLLQAQKTGRLARHICLIHFALDNRQSKAVLYRVAARDANRPCADAQIPKKSPELMTRTDTCAADQCYWPGPDYWIRALWCLFPEYRRDWRV